MEQGGTSSLPYLISSGNSFVLPKSSNAQSREENDHIYFPNFDAAWMYCTHDSARSEAAVDDFESKKELPPPLERAQVAQHLQRKRILTMLDSDYEKAEKFYLVNKRFASACVANNRESTQQAQLLLINDRISEIESSLNQRRKNWDDKIEQFIAMSKQKLEEIKRQNAEELRNFDEYWTSEEAMKKFSSPSRLLTELREKEQTLVVLHDFQEAASVRTQVIKLEHEETKIAQKNAEKEVVKKRKSLISSHMVRISRANKYENRIVNDMKIRKMHEVQNLKTRLAKLVIDREKGNFREPSYSTLHESQRTAQIPMALTTPKTRQKLLNFRNSTTAAKLRLKPIDSRPNTTIGRVRIEL